MFSIFESVILVFAKKSCKSANQEKLKIVKTLGRQRMKIQEASKDIT